ncbi:MAG: hypothetical protein ACOC4J_05645 [Bacteroidota bacterium]
MKNISTNGENIKLQTGKIYYVIDALYLHQIGEELQEIAEDDDLDKILKEKVFPYTDTPFAKITAEKETFNINFIESVDCNDIDIDDMSCFSTDSGLLIVVKEEYLLKLIGSFNYDKLVDSFQDDINIQNWEEITSNFKELDMALILAPGINTEFEFTGSGTYKIKQH